MAFFGPQRTDKVAYRYEVPTLNELEQWISRGPTMVNVSPETIRPGHAVWNDSDLWLCLNVIPLDDSWVDIHWVYFDRNDKTEHHQQQTFLSGSGNLWRCAVKLLVPIPGDFCPLCNHKLEWASLALRCPNCLYVDL